jgi:hypothetical protein
MYNQQIKEEVKGQNYQKKQTKNPFNLIIDIYVLYSNFSSNITKEKNVTLSGSYFKYQRSSFLACLLINYISEVRIIWRCFTMEIFYL